MAAVVGNVGQQQRAGAPAAVNRPRSSSTGRAQITAGAVGRSAAPPPGFYRLQGGHPQLQQQQQHPAAVMPQVQQQQQLQVGGHQPAGGLPPVPPAGGLPPIPPVGAPPPPAPPVGSFSDRVRAWWISGPNPKPPNVSLLHSFASPSLNAATQLSSNDDCIMMLEKINAYRGTELGRLHSLLQNSRFPDLTPETEALINHFKTTVEAQKNAKTCIDRYHQKANFGTPDVVKNRSERFSDAFANYERSNLVQKEVIDLFLSKLNVTTQTLLPQQNAPRAAQPNSLALQFIKKHYLVSGGLALSAVTAFKAACNVASSGFGLSSVPAIAAASLTALGTYIGAKRSEQPGTPGALSKLREVSRTTLCNFGKEYASSSLIVGPALAALAYNPNNPLVAEGLLFGHGLIYAGQLYLQNQAAIAANAASIGRSITGAINNRVTPDNPSILNRRVPALQPIDTNDQCISQLENLNARREPLLLELKNAMSERFPTGNAAQDETSRKDLKAQYLKTLALRELSNTCMQKYSKTPFDRIAGRRLEPPQIREQRQKYSKAAAKSEELDALQKKVLHWLNSTAGIDLNSLKLPTPVAAPTLTSGCQFIQKHPGFSIFAGISSALSAAAFFHPGLVDYKLCIGLAGASAATIGLSSGAIKDGLQEGKKALKSLGSSLCSSSLLIGSSLIGAIWLSRLPWIAQGIESAVKQLPVANFIYSCTPSWAYHPLTISSASVAAFGLGFFINNKETAGKDARFAIRSGANKINDAIKAYFRNGHFTGIPVAAGAWLAGGTPWLASVYSAHLLGSVLVNLTDE